jgi:glycosyltransferase involved in cell wall biosynthesis
VGDGPESDEIKINVEKYGLKDFFKFVGYQKDVLSFIHRMDFVILPSKSEGFPNVVLEAMACQKPVVATRVGGVSEVVIDGETGIIIEPGDVTALSNSINNLCGNEDLRKKMGIAAFKRAHEHFGIDKMIEKHSKYYLGKIT